MLDCIGIGGECSSVISGVDNGFGVETADDCTVSESVISHCIVSPVDCELGPVGDIVGGGIGGECSSVISGVLYKCQSSHQNINTWNQPGSKKTAHYSTYIL